MRFSLSSWKKSDSAAAGTTVAASGGGMRMRALILVAVLGAGAVGYKMFWPDSVPLKAAAAAMKTALTQKASANGAKPRPQAAAATNLPRGNNAPKLKSKSNPDDTDIPSPSEIARGPNGRPMPATRPFPTPLNDSLLGPVLLDETNGFSMRFPAGWAIRTFAGEPWVLDCGDGRLGLVSIGFSPFPADFTADNIPPEWVARRIKKRGDTTLHSQGYALIAGRKALWSKSTGPLPMSNGEPKMTRVNYIVPLGDGRVMELRIAATPELFEQLMPTLRQSVESFKVLPRVATTK